MGKNVYYDPNDRVIFVDFSGLTLNREILDQVSKDIIEIAQSHPQKLYAIACWKDTRIDPAFTDYYREAVARLLQHVNAIVRYEANNPYTNITIRSQTIQGHLQGSQSHIYPNREEALAAIRKMQQEKR